jgi:hypothetical protein
MAEANLLEILSILVNCGLLLVGSAGVVAAFMALSTWKHQRKASFAEEVIIYANTLHDLIYDIRNPFTYPSESKDRPRLEDESSDVSRLIDTFYAPISRIIKSGDIMDKYHLISLKVQLYSSRNVSDLNELKQIILGIKNASEELCGYTATHALNIEIDRVKELKAIIWRQKEDAISLKATEAVARIEASLKRYI